jgi:Holliday junction DNA helicase RuvB
MSGVDGPESLRQMVGQDKARKQLIRVVDAAKGSARQPDHMLLLGPGGTGKTVVSKLIAERLEAPFVAVSAGQVRSPKQMIKKLLSLKPGTLILIDEFHRVSEAALETVLFIAMSESVVDVDTGDDIQRVPLPPFTLLAATTENENSPSMLSRFGVKVIFKYYTVSQLTVILTAAANKRGFTVEPGAAELLAATAHGVAREVINRLSRACDEAILACVDTITVDLARASLVNADLDDAGLDFRQREILIAVAREYQPIGLESIGSLTGYTTIGSEIDLLTRIGLLRKCGNQGRMATNKAYDLIGEARPVVTTHGR